MSFFDIIAPIYDKFFKSKSDFLKLYKLISFNQDDKVLDLGGGTGRIANYFKYYVDEVIVADSSKQMIKRCQCQKALKCIVARAEELPFNAEYFDKIILFDSFHHINDQTRALEEIYRVMKQGGLLIVVEINPEKIIGQFVRIAESFLAMKSKFYSPEKLNDLIKKYKFETKLINQNKVIYYLIGTKKL